MKQFLVIFVAICCITSASKANNQNKKPNSIASPIELNTESNDTPDCVAGWKYVGTFDAVESSENPRTIEVRLYKNIMGDKSFKVVVEKKKDVGFIFTRYEIYNECYSCTIDEGIAYFRIDNSLWSVRVPQN